MHSKVSDYHRKIKSFTNKVLFMYVISGSEMDVKDLTADQLKELLISLNMKEYEHLVVSKKITGEFLSLCENVEHVKELGIEKSIHAKTLLNVVRTRVRSTGESSKLYNVFSSYLVIMI